MVTFVLSRLSCTYLYVGAREIISRSAPINELDCITFESEISGFLYFPEQTSPRSLTRLLQVGTLETRLIAIELNCASDKKKTLRSFKLSKLCGSACLCFIGLTEAPENL